MAKVGRYSEKASIQACLSKTKWSREESAQRALARIRRDHPDRMSSLVRPYRCRATGEPHWHLGHE